jgi:hypothetical protein
VWDTSHIDSTPLKNAGDAAGTRPVHKIKLTETPEITPYVGASRRGAVASPYGGAPSDRTPRLFLFNAAPQRERQASNAWARNTLMLKTANRAVAASVIALLLRYLEGWRKCIADKSRSG